MKFLFSILISLALSGNLSAQKTTADTAAIDFRCGWAAYSCPEIKEYQKLVASGSYELIRTKLVSGTLTEKVLSAMVITELTRAKRIELNASEEKLLKAITNSEERLEVCYTCTWHYRGSIKGFFHPGKEKGMTELTPYGPILDGLFGR